MAGREDSPRVGVGKEKSRSHAAHYASSQSQRTLHALLDASSDSMLLIDPQGVVLEFNRTVALRLGADHDQLRGSTIYDWFPREVAEYRRAYMERAVETRGPVEFADERDGRQLRTSVNPVFDEEGNVVALAIYSTDVTQQLLMERERRITIKLLHLLDAATDLHGLMKEATEILHDWSGCQAVGIRLREGDDYPYFETRGFSSSFVQKENFLCPRDETGALLCDHLGRPALECMCGNVLLGRFNPALPFFTANGSFWTNSTSDLLAGTSVADRQGRTRNRCRGEGYESVALIPLRAGGETFGLLQLNDPQRDKFSEEMIAQLERLAGNLAMGLAQRKALDELQESEAKFRAIFEQAPNSILLIDASTGRIVDCNDVASATLGYSHDELARLTIGDIGEGEISVTAAECHATARTGLSTFETVHRTKAGQERNMLVNCRSVQIHGRKLLLHICTDISQRKEIEEQFKQYERITSATPDSISLVDRDYRYRTVNDTYLRRTGLTRDQIVGHRVEEFLGREKFRSDVKTKLDQCLSGLEVCYQDWFHFGREGRRFLDVRYTPYQDADGSITGALASTRDITDLKRAEEQLRESEERYRLLVNVAPISILVVQDGRYVFVNSHAADWLGYEQPEDLTGVDALVAIAPEDREKIRGRTRRIENGEANPTMEVRVLRRDRSTILAELASVPIMLGGRPAALVVGQDITERRRIERLQGEAEKLASTGRMAARVAHEINNPLAGIKYAFRLIKDAVPAAHPDRDMVDRIEAEIDRIAHIVRQMYALHSPGAAKSRKQLVHAALQDVLMLLEPLRREQAVTIRVAPVSKEYLVNLPESSLHQVLFNLIANALEASLPHDTIDILLRQQDEYVVIAVVDHGVGIPLEIQQRIFEPSFTTKGDSGLRPSMGIGLSIVRNIVDSCGGRIELESEPGQGTAIRIFFPAV